MPDFEFSPAQEWGRAGQSLSRGSPSSWGHSVEPNWAPPGCAASAQQVPPASSVLGSGFGQPQQFGSQDFGGGGFGQPLAGGGFGGQPEQFGSQDFGGGGFGQPQQFGQQFGSQPVWESPASSVSPVSSAAAAKIAPAAPVTGVMKCPYTVHNDGSCWKLTVQQKGDYFTATVPGTHELDSVTSMDEIYINGNFATQRIALRLAKVLEPSLLVQSLRSALGAYPRVGSQLKLYYGKPAYHLRSGQIDVHVIKVGRDVLSQSPCTWLHVCEKTMPPRTAAGQNCGPDASPLFEAVMLVSDVLSAGCKLSATSFPTVELQLPPMVPQQNSAIRRLFTFSAEGADSLKMRVPAGCTTNDALMAQVACVLGHIRFGAAAAMGMAAEQAGAARIAIMADRRGRGLPIDTWGNHAVDLQIDISCQLLGRGDVAAVACAIRAAVRDELQKLELGLPLYTEYMKTKGQKPFLFVWTSWSRHGRSLRSARFGGAPKDVLQVEWLNLQVLDCRPGDTTVAISPSNDSGFTIAIANRASSAQAEMTALESLWPDHVTNPPKPPKKIGCFNKMVLF